MAEIDSLGSNVYFSGVQNAANEALKKNRKTEEAKSTKKTKFSEILHNKSEISKQDFSLNGLPQELSTMSVEEAVNYLVDEVNLAGNDLSENLNKENLQKFKDSVSTFLRFVVNNNYQVKSHLSRRAMPVSSPTFFSNYSLPSHKPNPRYQVQIINDKLAKLTAATIEGQKNNLLILSQIDEIKGLIIDLIE